MPTKTIQQINADLHDAYVELASALEEYIYDATKGKDSSRVLQAHDRIDSLMQLKSAVDSMNFYKFAKS